jgi:hypothetical protein
MNNKLLILSFVFLTIAKIDSAQKEEQGGVMIRHSPPPLLPSHVLSGGAKKVSKELNVTITDPYELEEMHVDLFNKGQFTESSRALIASAIHGNEDNRSFLCGIDSQSLKYLTSQYPQSAEALSYYDNTLLPKVVENAKLQYMKLKERENKPMVLFWEK